MSRFDAWLSDEISQKREEPANDSTQAEAATQTEENTGSVPDTEPENTVSFSNLEASTATMGADYDDSGDLADGDGETADNGPDVAALPAVRPVRCR